VTDGPSEGANRPVRWYMYSKYLEDEVVFPPWHLPTLPLQNLLAQAGGQPTLLRLGLPGISEHFAWLLHG